MTTDGNGKSENKDNGIWTTSKRNALQAVINDESKIKDDFYKVNVRSDSESKKLQVYRIKHNILGYNFDNGRIIAEKTEYEQKHNVRLDPTNDDHQKQVGEILYTSKFYSKTATKELEADIKEKGLDEPLIVSIDGTTWNGNRRLSIYRKLYEETANQKYEWVNVVVLPELSHKDLKRLEHRLQLYKEWKEDYGKLQTRLIVRESMNSTKWEINEIIKSFGNKYDENELKQFVKEIDLIDDYLERIKRPKEYVFIETGDGDRGKGVESFATLNSTLRKLEKRGEKLLEIEKTKLSGLQIIHNPESTYHDIRNYDAVMSNSVARDEFKENSYTFKNFNELTRGDGKNAFSNECLKKEYENLEFPYQVVQNYKKDPKKIASSALNMLKKIDEGKIPRTEEFKEIIHGLEKQINRLKSKFK